jgi:hypothetical protein
MTLGESLRDSERQYSRPKPQSSTAALVLLEQLISSPIVFSLRDEPLIVAALGPKTVSKRQSLFPISQKRKEQEEGADISIKDRNGPERSEVPRRYINGQRTTLAAPLPSFSEFGGLHTCVPPLSNLLAIGD